MEDFERFDIKSKKDPSFRGRFNLSYLNIPMRAYIHNAGFTDAYKNENKALSYLLETYSLEIERFNPQYIISAVWGDNEDRMVDFFLYSGIDINDKPKPNNWQYANPDKQIVVTRNGEIISDWKNCEDVDLLLGEEGKHRRNTPNLRDFMRNPPNLEGIGLSVSK